MRNKFVFACWVYVFANPVIADEIECDVEVSNRTGTLDRERCRDNKGGSWACYEEVKEICRDKISGFKTEKKYNHFTGTCASLSDCWKANGNGLFEGTFTHKKSGQKSRGKHKGKGKQNGFGFSFGYSSANEMPADEKWDCVEEIDSRSWELQPYECRHSSGPYNCTEKIIETCKEQYSGQKITKERNKIIKVCVASAFECR